MSIAQINKPARVLVRVFVAIFFVVAMASGIREAKAAEAGVGVYFLGFRGALAGFVPPPGTYVQSDKIFYSASSSKDQLFDFGGRIVADVKADAVLDVLTATWVPQTTFLGGHLGLSASLPVGWMKVSAGAELTGPRGRSLSRNRADDIVDFGDLYLTGLLGWHHQAWHWNVNVGINAPTGAWEKGRLANLGFNYWAVDLGFAVTYLDPKTGLEFSFAPGITFNAKNNATNYKTGNEFHLEVAALMRPSQQFAFGVTGYHYQQLTDDSGAGAVLGGFKGRVTAVGPILTYDFKIRDISVSSNFRWMHEFNVERRLKGDVIFATFAVPL